MEKKNVLKKPSIDEMTAFCKRKGFIVRSGEIYGGLAGFWDYLFLGSELKNNLKNAWWQFHVRERDDIEGIDGAIITHPDVWKASGHVDSFSDVFVVCKKCKKPGKVDKSELGKVKCECGGEYDSSSAKEFKLMFKTEVGLKDYGYLRPETAQLIFANFKAVFDEARMKLPCGIAQMGKAFRNEIAPRNFIFRCREFEQMEIEYFIKPKEKCPYDIPDVEVLVLASGETKEKKMSLKEAHKKKIIKKDWHAYWLGQELSFFKSLGANLDNFRIRQHDREELAHYSSDCWDLEYNFPFGWKELQGIADRSDYDLKQHQKFSKTKMEVLDEETKERFIPEVICEPSLGVERALLVFLYEAYNEREKENIVLNFNPKLSPVKVGVFPLIKKEEFENIGLSIFHNLRKKWNVVYDKSGSIGRRYARQDEIGTPYCITIDGDSVDSGTVTIRNRDTTLQKKIKIEKLEETLGKLLYGEFTFESLK